MEQYWEKQRQEEEKRPKIWAERDFFRYCISYIEKMNDWSEDDYDVVFSYSDGQLKIKARNLELCCPASGNFYGTLTFSARQLYRNMPKRLLNRIVLIVVRNDDQATIASHVLPAKWIEKQPLAEAADHPTESSAQQGSLFDSLDSVPINPMILKALDLAAKAHATQFRKGTDTPYISHPSAVGILLSHYGCSATVVAAGILHDTVEDGGASLDEIAKLFGPEVAEIVEGCSEPDKSATWISRKQHTIEYLRTAPRNVKLAAAADKLHNVTSMLTDYEEHGEALWGRFKVGREDQEWYYRGVVESLGSDDFKKHPLYVDLKLAVGRMFDVGNTVQKLKEGSFMEPLSPRMQELMAQSRALPQLPPEEAAEFKRRGDLLAAGMCAMINKSVEEKTPKPGGEN